jgi:hypothetical protein
VWRKILQEGAECVHRRRREVKLGMSARVVVSHFTRMNVFRDITHSRDTKRFWEYAQKISCKYIKGELRYKCVCLCMRKFCFVLGKCPRTGVSLQQAMPIYSVLIDITWECREATILMKLLNIRDTVLSWTCFMLCPNKMCLGLFSLLNILWLWLVSWSIPLNYTKYKLVC